TALRLKLEAFNNDGVEGGKLDELKAMVKRLDSDIDFLAWELRPLALDDLGLAAVLANYARQWSQHFNIPAQLHSALEGRRFPPNIESNIYRIAQEALNNCAKHANCSRVNVILELREGRLVLIIEDNGAGFDSRTGVESGKHMGLLGMRERA